MAFPEEMMAPYTIYYWHVVAHTDNGDVQGPVWWLETDNCFGDFNGDDDVDGKDLAEFSAAMVSYNAVADYSNDNVVDGLDLKMLICNFGKTACGYPVASISADKLR